MLDLLKRKLEAVAPVRLDNNGVNPGDLWKNDYGDGGHYIGNIDEPLYADLIVAAVNALPSLLAVVEAAIAYEAVVVALDTAEGDGQKELRFQEHMALAALRAALVDTNENEDA